MPQLTRSLSVTLVLAGLIVQSTASQSVAQTAPATPAAAPKSPYETLLTGAKKVEGMWTLHQKDQQLFLELSPSQLNQNYLVVISIAKGISRGQVLGGMSWGFGDDPIWAFQKVGEKIHVLRRNVRFRAAPNSPEANAVKLAYSDSVLYALPIAATGPGGGMLVDVSRIFMSDDQQIGRSIGMAFAQDRSTWAKVKAFSENVELQVAAVYAGTTDFDTVVDPRGVQVNVHYSIRQLPNTGYQPRLADDRVGYFLTVIKDFTDKGDTQHFVRYINRWQLEKKDPSLKLSPPKAPIKFWVEKTVPIALRKAVKEGILEWNKAYEKVGFHDAIQVEDQPDNADWDPEDVRYNTFRWITANAGFAMGPSRVNPITGQILDADIIFDADFMTHWKQEYETLTAASAAELMNGPLDPRDRKAGELFAQGQVSTPFLLPQSVCNYGHGMSQQMGFASAVMLGRGDISAKGELPEEFVNQALKEVVMHEVGHTLGLRHNFKASSWKTLAEIDDPVKGASEGTVGSVMDYSPTNIAPGGVKQGLYYTHTIGPYDYWAIEYGYKPVAGDEKAELAKIAARSAEPGLDYATDEDTRGTIDSDPLVNRFDMGKDPLEFVKRQQKIAKELWPKVIERSVDNGQGFQKARQAFGMLFNEYWRSMQFVARFPGGIYMHRDHKGDANGRTPHKLVEPAKQREAMKLISESAFQFNFDNLPPDTFNFLAASRWSHWGLRDSRRLDYSPHTTVALVQEQILFQLLASTTLVRLYDGELKVAPDGDAYTMAEHIRLVVESIFTEWRDAPKPGNYSNRKPYVNSFRRNLQRSAVKELAAIVQLPFGDTPEDARTLSRFHLGELDKQITTLLTTKDLNLDDYTKSHLLDCQERIQKVLKASLIIQTIN
ncbi:MAG: zinc-dependent metalloprotease [Planctomycetales bacterium]|nr:zinc-dependent metalloprotease [Planctomycetales bacterium]